MKDLLNISSIDAFSLFLNSSAEDCKIILPLSINITSSNILSISDYVLCVDKGEIVLASDADELRNKENDSIDEIFRGMFKC